jgi:predicted phosphodiesterase
MSDDIDPPDPFDLGATRRIGLIGDVHTEADLLERAIRELRALGADVVFCVGDLATGRGDLARCCDLLQHHGVFTVRGNHDRWLLADLAQDPDSPAVRARLPVGVLTHLVRLRESVPTATARYLASLPPTRTFMTSRGLTMLCHGLGANDVAGVLPEWSAEILAADAELLALLARSELRLVLNGHTHHRMVRRVDHLTIVNAGTLHPDQGPGAALLDLELGKVLWLDLGAPASSAPELLGELP